MSAYCLPPIATAIYNRLIAAPSKWFKTPEGRTLYARSLRLVRQREGRKAAADLRDELAVANVITDSYYRVALYRMQ